MNIEIYIETAKVLMVLIGMALMGVSLFLSPSSAKAAFGIGGALFFCGLLALL